MISKKFGIFVFTVVLIFESGFISAQDAATLWERAIEYAQKEDYDNAIVAYTQVIRLDPNYAPAYNSRGRLYLFEGDYDKAIADFTEAIRRNYDVGSAYYSGAP
jgi:tetratricopeptide (TPR) repeat protein